MELKEAIERLKEDVKYADLRDTVDEDCTICYIEDIDTVLQALENSIPKKVIENELKQIEIEHNSRLEKCETKEEKDIITAEYNSMRCILEDILEGENEGNKI